MAAAMPFRWLYLVLGWLFTVLGVIGAVLPLMPATVFFLLALWAFARGSPSWHAWLRAHPRFGPSLIAWQDHGAITPAAKRAALVAIATSYVLTASLAGLSIEALIALALVLVAVLVFIFSRPDRPRPTRARAAATRKNRPTGSPR
ncbi:MAG: YbaN family protein [Geminicoccaceae bacterium]